MNGSNQVTRSRPSRSQNASKLLVVDRRLRVRLRGELGRRRVAALLEEERARSSCGVWSVTRSSARSRGSSRSRSSVARAVLGDEHEILEAHAAVARAVEARLDRDDVARLERRLSTPGPCPAARAPRARRRGRARGRSRPRAARPASSCAGSGSRRPRRSRTSPSKTVLPVDARRGSRETARSSASLQSRCHSRDLVGHLADDERPRHVGEARRTRCRAARCRSRSARPAAIGPEPMSWPIARLRPVRDDEVVGGRAVARRTPAAIAALTRSTVSGSPSSVEPPSPFGSARRSRSRAASIPASAARLRAADARELAPASSRGGGRRRTRASDGQLDARRRAAGRRARAGTLAGTTALVDAERAHRAQRDLVADLGVRHAAAPQLVEPELLERVQLEAARAPRAAGSPSSRSTMCRVAVLLDVEERVGDAERHLVPELGRAEVSAYMRTSGTARTLTPRCWLPRMDVSFRAWPTHGRALELVVRYDEELRRLLPDGRGDLRRPPAPRARHRRDGRRLRPARAADGPLRDLARVHVLPRRARPAPGLHARRTTARSRSPSARTGG